MSANAPHPYHRFVAELSRALTDGAALPLGNLPPRSIPARKAGAPTALILAPHPDDECIVGALPLRLLREAGMRVVAAAVTLGSDRSRRQPRQREMEGACRFLGFEPAVVASGLERIVPETRAADPAHWQNAVDAVAALIEKSYPQVLFFPHAADGNKTHMGTHALVQDALGRQAPSFACVVFETEYWFPMVDPNRLVESRAEDVADLVAAIGFHAGEVARNPYHLRLPGWMMDNVRRGAEILGGQGGTAPPFEFGTLYRQSRWAQGRLEPSNEPRLLGAGDSLKTTA